MHGAIQFTNKNLIVFNYIFPSIDLNFNSAGSQFIKSQPSLKLINIIKQTASVKGGCYLQSQRLLILFSSMLPFGIYVRCRLISSSNSITTSSILFVSLFINCPVKKYQNKQVKKDTGSWLQKAV